MKAMKVKVELLGFPGRDDPGELELAGGNVSDLVAALGLEAPAALLVCRGDEAQPLAACAADRLVPGETVLLIRPLAGG